MTVKELINKLKEVPQDLEVYLGIDQSLRHCNHLTVEVDEIILED